MVQYWLIAKMSQIYMIINVSTTFWRRRFGADVLAPTFWRRRFSANVLAPGRFGAKTFWRKDFLALIQLGADVLAPSQFGLKKF